jgi:hypothetical protein
MAFTYDLTTNRGKVRFLIPDTDSAAYDLSDAEVDYFLADKGAVKPAAIAACKWLARKYAKMVSFSADGLSVQAGQRAQTYAERAKELVAEEGGWGVVTMDKEDGYSDAGDDTSEYTSDDIVYVRI